MARSRWKLSFFTPSVWRRIFFLKKKKFLKKRKVFYERSSSIPFCFYAYILRIHKGKNIRKLLIHIYNIGYKFGEFSYTRKPFHFPLRKMKKRKNLLRR